jgi:hypothetical protein
VRCPTDVVFTLCGSSPVQAGVRVPRCEGGRVRLAAMVPQVVGCGWGLGSQWQVD